MNGKPKLNDQDWGVSYFSPISLVFLKDKSSLKVNEETADLLMVYTEFSTVRNYNPPKFSVMFLNVGYEL